MEIHITEEGKVPLHFSGISHFTAHLKTFDGDLLSIIMLSPEQWERLVDRFGIEELPRHDKDV